MKTLIVSPITEALQKAMSYSTYRKLVSDLIKEGKSTGDEQTEALTNYSILNDRRMKRQDKAQGFLKKGCNKSRTTRKTLPGCYLQKAGVVMRHKQCQ